MTKLLAAMLMPPLNVLLLAVLGAVLQIKWPRIGRAVLVLSLVCAYALSTPVITGACLRYLETGAAPGNAQMASIVTEQRAAAIVVLGGGSYFDAPEYGGDTVGESTLVRLRWAAHLQRTSNLPVLVAGGSPFERESTEADQMQRVLAQDFGVPVRWLDRLSRDTFESAFNARKILIDAEGINQIALVTHAWHMPRAKMVFERAGFKVTPAATLFTTRTPAKPTDFLPSAFGMRMAASCLHEVIGIGWYHLRLLQLN